jgi:hypothetical protein
MIAMAKRKSLDKMTPIELKTFENRLRRMASRQGYELSKSRLRDPRAIGYGGYMIIDASTNHVAAGGHPHAHTMSLDEIEAWLLSDRPATRK